MRKKTWFVKILPIALLCGALAGCWPIKNEDPKAAFTATPMAGEAPLTVVFDAFGACSDSDGYIVAYSWDFGDGQYGSGETVTYTYAVAGTYTVQLRITDDDGASDYASRTITVSAPSNPQPGAPTWELLHSTVQDAIIGKGLGEGVPWQAGIPTPVSIYAVENLSGDIFKNDSEGNWAKVGGPGSMFVVGGPGELYALTVPRTEVRWYRTSLGGVWMPVGGAAARIFGAYGGLWEALYAMPPASGDLMQLTETGWQRICDYHDSGTTIDAWYAFGDNGKVYALLDGLIYRYDGAPLQWTHIGGPATWIAAAENVLYAVDPVTGGLWEYNGSPFDWTPIGLASAEYSVGDDDHLYSVSIDRTAVYRYKGIPLQWEQIGAVGADLGFSIAGIRAASNVLLVLDGTTPGYRLWKYEAP